MKKIDKYILLEYSLKIGLILLALAIIVGATYLKYKINN